MSFYHNLPEYFGRAGVSPQEVSPGLPTPENREFLRQLSVESYRTSKVQISGILHADNTVSDRTETSRSTRWSRSSLEKGRGAYLFRTLFLHNFNTSEVSWLLMETYLAQVQLNALFVGPDGFWYLVITPIESGKNTVVDAEMEKVYGKIIADLRRLTPTSENVTKALRGMGYLQFVSHTNPSEPFAATQRYVPRIGAVAGVLMAMSMLAAVFRYDRDGAVTIEPEATKGKAVFAVKPERMYHPSPELGQATIEALSPGTPQQVRFVSPASLAGTKSKFASPEWRTPGMRAQAVTVGDVTFPDSAPGSRGQGDAIIMKPPTPPNPDIGRLLQSGGEYKFKFIYVLAGEIGNAFEEGDTLMIAPPPDSGTPGPEFLLTMDEKVLFQYKDEGIMAELADAPAQSGVVDAIKVAPTRPDGILQPIKFQRFAFAGEDPRTLAPVQLTAQDAHELNDEQQNQLVAWIDVIDKEKAWDTYKATWSLSGEARALMYRLIPYLGPQLGSIHVETLAPRMLNRIQRDVDYFRRTLGVTTATPQELSLAATWVEHYYDPAGVQQAMEAELRELLEKTLLNKHMPGKIADTVVGVIKLATAESSRQLYGDFARLFLRASTGLTGQIAQDAAPALRMSKEYVAAKLQQHAFSVRRKMIEDESLQFANRPHEELSPRLQELLESALQHAGLEHEFKKNERALQVEGILNDIVRGGITNVAGYIADAVLFIVNKAGYIAAAGDAADETATEALHPVAIRYDMPTQYVQMVGQGAAASDSERDQSVGIGIGQALESVADGRESINAITERIDSVSGLYDMPEQSARTVVQGAAAAPPLVDLTGEDYGFLRRDLIAMREASLKSLYREATSGSDRLPNFTEFHDRLQKLKSFVEQEGGSRFLPTDALDNINLFLATSAAFEAYVDELHLDVYKESWYKRAYEDKREGDPRYLDDLYDYVDEIFEFPNMVAGVVEEISWLPLEGQSDFLDSARAKKVEFKGQDDVAQLNGGTIKYVDRRVLSRAVFDATRLPQTDPEAPWDPQVGPAGREAADIRPQTTAGFINAPLPPAPGTIALPAENIAQAVTDGRIF